MRRLALLVGLLGTLAACTDSTEPSDPVSGRWRGGSVGLSLDLTVAREGADVRGSGNLLFVSSATALTVAGTWVAPHISLVLSSPGFQDTHFGGTLENGVITGLLNGSGFTDVEIILSRD